MPLNIASIDERMDAAIEAVIERLARAALVDIRKMAKFARRSFGQRARRIKERMKTHDARI